MSDSENSEVTEDILTVAKRHSYDNLSLQVNDVYKNEEVLDNELKCNFLLTVHNFSEWDNKDSPISVESQIFKMDGNENIAWILSVKSNRYQDTDCLSVYLKPMFTKNIKVQASYSVSLLNKIDNIYTSVVSDKVFEKNSPSYGWPKYITKENILDLGDFLLQDDELNILCCIEAHIIGHSNLKTIRVSSEADDSPPKKRITFEQNAPKNINHSTWENLYQNNLLSDVTIVVGNKEIKSHKCVLAAASPVFLDRFQNKETSVNCIEIMDATYEIVIEMLRFIYIKKVENLHNIAHELMIIANKYGINDLKNLCEESLCLNIDSNNIGKMILIGDSCNAEKLISSAVDFIVNNKTEFKENPDYEQIVFSCPRITKQLLLSLI